VGAERLRAAASGGGPVAGDPQGEDLGRWLQLPGPLPARVRDLGLRLAAQPTRYDTVRAVEDHLRSSATYRLDAPVPGEGEDAVDHFLFQSREGYCEHFASAEVVLLRSAGIPARLAVGFAGGEPAAGPAGAPADAGVTGDLGGARLVRGTQAHAWVEVWFPGVGWVSSDPTAGTTLADPPALDRLGQWVRDHAVALGALAVVLALAVAAVVVLARRRRPLAGAGAGRGRLVGGAADLVAAFDRLEDALDRTGVPRRTQETLAELGARLTRGDDRYAGAAPPDLELVDPAPSDPAPSDPAPSDPAPSDPAPFDPAPSDAAPFDPAPFDPAPFDPAPFDPAPFDPAPFDPAPFDPAPSGTLPGPAAALAVLERLLYAAAPPPAADLRAAAQALDAVSARVLAASRDQRLLARQTQQMGLTR
jgi:hypothetical protein